MMKFDRVLFLAARTVRSNAYAQAILARGVRLSHAIILDRKQESDNPVFVNPERQVVSRGVSLFHPEFEQIIELSIEQLCDEIDLLEVDNVNDPRVCSTVEEAVRDGIELIIYSGFGGQLVGSPLLALGVPFLHAHSGWLPEYRGSTTIYFSLLTENKCAVSVLLLSPDLDQGSIVGRREYSLPLPGVDIDFVYDSIIRADLLSTVLVNWELNGREFTEVDLRRENGRGCEYFVIHPVLKHLAILSINNG